MTMQLLTGLTRFKTIPPIFQSIGIGLGSIGFVINVSSATALSKVNSNVAKRKPENTIQFMERSKSHFINKALGGG